MNKEKSVWVDLYNVLYIISSEYEELRYLESSIFEVFDELESSLLNGLSDQSLNLFQRETWINIQQRNELQKFRSHIDKINPKFWNNKDFDNYEDWILARSWANSLIVKLDIRKNGWDSTGEIIIQV